MLSVSVPVRTGCSPHAASSVTHPASPLRHAGSPTATISSPVVHGPSVHNFPPPIDETMMTAGGTRSPLLKGSPVYTIAPRSTLTMATQPSFLMASLPVPAGGQCLGAAATVTASGPAVVDTGGGGGGGKRGLKRHPELTKSRSLGMFA